MRGNVSPRCSVADYSVAFMVVFVGLASIILFGPWMVC